MQTKFLDYPLKDGYFHNWLVNGPDILPLNEFSADNIDELSGEVKSRDDKRLPITQRPVERELMQLVQEEKRWQYFSCRDDHKVHFSSRVPTWSLLHYWAYCGLKLPSKISVQLSIMTRFPIKIWQNGALIFERDSFSQEEESSSIKIILVEENDIIVRLDDIAAGENSVNFSVKAVGEDTSEFFDSNIIQLPTPAHFPHRYKIFEEMFEHVYLDEIVNHWGPEIQLRWAEGYENDNYFRYQVQDETGGFIVDGNSKVDAENPQVVGHPYRLFEKTYWVTLTPTIREYGNQWIRYTKRLPIHVLDTAFSSSIYGSPASRREEALKDACKHEKNIFAMVARLELGRSEELINDTVLNAAERVNKRYVGSELDLCGLLLMEYRFGKVSTSSGSSPSIPNTLSEAIEASALNYRYMKEDPGLDALTFHRESSQILFHTCEALAGQLYPNAVFNTSGKKGSWHKERGERFSAAWMKQRASNGFEDWNTNSEWQDIFLALSQILSLVENDVIQELSAVLLDKMIFLLAVNTFKGVFGVSHGRTSTGMLKSAQLEGTSGITRMLWGAGVYNRHISGTVGLACSDYEFPSFFKDLAVSQPKALLSREKQFSPDGREVNLATYKTPDFMLSSAQEFQPGERGSSEHIWQATFGPDAIVYTTHPANSGDEPGNQPGYWLGNGFLPKVVQWNDVLIAEYNLPDDVVLGFTHAYFPTPAFDEYVLTSGWVFARKGDGYLGICTANGIEFTRQGPDAYRELRSFGKQNTWVCQLGRQELDGSFEEFQGKVNALNLAWKPSGVEIETLRGDQLSLGWSDSFLVNGEIVETTGIYHIENPYCTTPLPTSSMDIQYEDILMRLNFS